MREQRSGGTEAFNGNLKDKGTGNRREVRKVQKTSKQRSEEAKLFMVTLRAKGLRIREK